MNYSLKSFKPYDEVLKRRKEVQLKIDAAKAALSADLGRLKVLEDEAAQVIAGGEEGYTQKMNEVRDCQLKIDAITKEIEILNSAMELIKKELVAQTKEAKKQIRAAARADHEKIVARGLASVKELRAALVAEEKLVQAVQRPLGGADFLVLLASAFQCHESDLRWYRERISDKGYSKGVK